MHAQLLQVCWSSHFYPRHHLYNKQTLFLSFSFSPIHAQVQLQIAKVLGWLYLPYFPNWKTVGVWGEEELANI